jgi:hypothetical protein
MRELLQRPSTDYEAAARAENHTEHLKAATTSSNSLPATILTQDLQAFKPAYGQAKNGAARRATAPTPATVRKTPPIKSKKRGRDSSSASTDSPDPTQAKKRKIAAVPVKGKRKAQCSSLPS